MVHPPTLHVPSSVGEVRFGLVPGHFCQTRDWTVQSLMKYLGLGLGLPGTVYIGLVPVQTRSRLGPACSVPLGLLWWPTGGCRCTGCIVMSPCVLGQHRYSQGALRSTWGMGEAE